MDNSPIPEPFKKELLYVVKTTGNLYSGPQGYS